MNVLFTTSAAPAKSPFFTTEKRPPLGLGSCMSVARNAKHAIFFIDNYLAQSRFIEEGFLQKHAIDLAAITANTICYRDTLRMFTEIQKLREGGKWKGKIAVGGPHTSVAVDTIPAFVDYIVQGEGERAILKILQHETEERILREERMQNLDMLPFQPWDVFSVLPYDYSCQWIDAWPIFTMNTSRGCPFSCSFCSVGSIWGKKYTYFSPGRIIAEIEYLEKDFGAHGVYFREDNFTLHRERTIAFCEKMIGRTTQIPWACETRVDNMSEDLIKLMSRAGCRAFYLGVESGSQRMLDVLKKNITVEQIENVVRWGKKYNVRAYCSFIVGTPDETFEDYLRTKKLIKKIKPYAVGINVFVGIPDSPLYRHIMEKKLYEHIDDVGLVYLPGYHIKTEFFYNMNSSRFIDHDFKEQSEFDRRLRRGLPAQKVKRTVSAYCGWLFRKRNAAGA